MLSWSFLPLNLRSSLRLLETVGKLMDYERPKLNAKECALKWKHILQGNMFIDGVPTKHYLKRGDQLVTGSGRPKDHEISENRIRLAY